MKEHIVYFMLMANTSVGHLCRLLFVAASGSYMVRGFWFMVSGFGTMNREPRTRDHVEGAASSRDRLMGRCVQGVGRARQAPAIKFCFMLTLPRPLPVSPPVWESS